MYLLVKRDKKNQIVIEEYVTKKNASEAMFQQVYDFLVVKNGNNLIRNEVDFRKFFIKNKETECANRADSIKFFARIGGNADKISVLELKTREKISSGIFYNTKSAENYFDLCFSLLIVYCKPFNKAEEIKATIRKADQQFSRQLCTMLNMRLVNSAVFVELRKSYDPRVSDVLRLDQKCEEKFYDNLLEKKEKKPIMPGNIHQIIAHEAAEALEQRRRSIKSQNKNQAK